jgi:hypothetical protein
VFSRSIPACLLELSTSSGDIGCAEMVSVELWLSGVLQIADKLSHSSWVDRGVQLLNCDLTGVPGQGLFAKLFSVGNS